MSARKRYVWVRIARHHQALAVIHVRDGMSFTARVYLPVARARTRCREIYWCDCLWDATPEEVRTWTGTRRTKAA